MKRSRITFAAVVASSAVFAAAPMLIPAPREMSVTGGRVALAAADAPKTEVVKSIPPEGYELSITTNAVTIRHSDDAGLFYAKMTLAQLRAGATDATIPCLEIKDAPAFKWRGVHLGETQRLFGKGTIKRMLDLMSRYKFNVFHWHFTDDRGWRIDFPEYPNLARKSDPPWLCSNEKALFYSKEDVREILASLAANMGYKVVQSPSRHTYFDYSQGLPDDPFRYFHPDRFTTTLETAYKFDPYEDVKPEARANVIGGQCCNWTKYTFTPRDLEWKMWPRALATAEILWTNPDPKKRDFAEFSARAAEHRRRLIREHVNCAPLK